METKGIKETKFWIRVFRLISIIGFILCLGSIFTFIVMNVVLGNAPSIDSIYLQRLFVSGITSILIIPGVSFIFIGAIFLSWMQYGFFRNTWVTIAQILIVLIVLNAINITLLAGKVTDMAIQQKQISAVIPEYMELKNWEDVFGALNIVMLLASLIIPFFYTEKTRL